MEKLTAAQKRDQAAQAKQELLGLCPLGTTVYTVLKTYNRAGTSRTMTVFVIELDQWEEKHQPRRINHLLAKIGVGRLMDDGSLQVRGGGMDMGFAVVNDMIGLLYSDADPETRKEAFRGIRQEWL